MAKGGLKLVHDADTAERRLPILTVLYYDTRAKEVAKRIRAGKALKAMQNCLGHMRRNTYEATLAEVYDTDTGKLYGIMKRSVDGQVHPIFQHKFKEGE